MEKSLTVMLMMEQKGEKNMTDEITELERHLGKGPMIEIDGEQVELKALSLESLPDFYKFMKCFIGAGESANPTDLFKNLDDVSLKALQNMIYKTLKKSCPDKSDDWINEKGMQYSLLLMSKIMELNSAGMSPDAEKKARLFQELEKRKIK